MSFKIIVGGKIKEKEIKSLIDDYLKRIKPFNITSVHFIKSSSVDDCSKAILEEEERYFKEIKGCDYKILLDIEGEMLSSKEFAKMIDDKQKKYGKVCFIIGGSCGVSDNVKKGCDFRLSFSRMTFPYQLFTLLFVEQLYRALTILKEKRYHK